MTKKAILMSIKPSWCDKIANGDKTIEIRKTKPKLETPFKVYIYCTKPSFPHEDFIFTDGGEGEIKGFYGGGKVIGEFVCNAVWMLAPICHAPDDDILALALPNRPTRLESPPVETIQPQRFRVRRNFNPDPRVADYESSASLFYEWTHDWK